LQKIGLAYLKSRAMTLIYRVCIKVLALWEICKRWTSSALTYLV